MLQNRVMLLLTSNKGQYLQRQQVDSKQVDSKQHDDTKSLTYCS